MSKNAVFCGIDVGLKNHAVCLLDESGDIIQEFVILNDSEGFAKLSQAMTKKTKCAMEPTGVYSINLYLFLNEHGFDVRFVETRSSMHFRKATSKDQKADRKDAIALAKYRIVNNDLTISGDSYVNRLLVSTFSHEKQILLPLLAECHRAQDEIQRIKNRLKRFIDLRFPEAVKVFADRGCKTICKLLCHPRQEILQGRVRANEQLVRLVRNTIGQFDTHQEEFSNLFKKQEELERTINEKSVELERHLLKFGYEDLLRNPSVGPVIAALFVTEALPITRFLRRKQNGVVDKKKSLRAFKAFCGLAVTRNQSGTHEGGQKLSKSGNRMLKTAIFNMARTFLSIKPERRKHYENSALNPTKYVHVYEIHKNHGKKGMLAFIKMMDKICTDIFFLLYHHEHPITGDEVCTLTQSTPCTVPMHPAIPA